MVEPPFQLIKLHVYIGLASKLFYYYVVPSHRLSPGPPRFTRIIIRNYDSSSSNGGFSYHINFINSQRPQHNPGIGKLIRLKNCTLWHNWSLIHFHHHHPANEYSNNAQIVSIHISTFPYHTVWQIHDMRQK